MSQRLLSNEDIENSARIDGQVISIDRTGIWVKCGEEEHSLSIPNPERDYRVGHQVSAYVRDDGKALLVRNLSTGCRHTSFPTESVKGSTLISMAVILGGPFGIMALLPIVCWLLYAYIGLVGLMKATEATIKGSIPCLALSLIGLVMGKDGAFLLAVAPIPSLFYTAWLAVKDMGKQHDAARSHIRAVMYEAERDGTDGAKPASA